VPDQEEITEAYRNVESSGVSRLPAPRRPPQAPQPATAPGDVPPPPVAAPSLDESWRNFQAPRRVSRTSPNSYSYGYGDGGSSEGTWGYRNPGGVGRRPEYYPPDDQFQNGGPHNYVAQFDQGPAATQRSAQLQSQSVGIARYNSIQGHIDRYGMPRIGYGWGFGGFGGFLPY
jgi:hypothetical protein